MLSGIDVKFNTNTVTDNYCKRKPARPDRQPGLHYEWEEREATRDIIVKYEQLHLLAFVFEVVAGGKGAG